MRIHYRNLEKTSCVCLLALLLCALSTPCFAGIDLPWSTTYDCPDWDNGDVNVNCDDLQRYLAHDIDGHFEQITSEANNPDGGGAKGQRHWYGDGTNQGSGGMQFSFNSIQPEFWFRWYMRYPLGFTWGGGQPHYDKFLYVTRVGTSFLRVRLAGNEIGWTDGYTMVDSTGGKGWSNINGGSTGDGQWHSYEIHCKTDTNGSNGIFEIWIDGILAVSRANVYYQTVAGFGSIAVGGNQENPTNGTYVPVDFDDLAASNTGYIGTLGGGDGGDTTSTVRSNGSPSGSLPAETTQTVISLDTDEVATCKYSTTANITYSSMLDTFSNTGGTSHSQLITDLSNGNNYTYYIRCQDGSGNTNNDDYSISFGVFQTDNQNVVLFSEAFEDVNLSSRGWYDNTSLILSSTEYVPSGGSTRSAEFHFAQGTSFPNSGAAIRHKFTEADEFYAEFWVKYSTGWQGSGQSYHPHEIFIMTNLDSDYAGMANTHTTVYIEQNALNPRLIIQDAQNINTSQGTPPVDLVSITEIRAVAGCNGDSDGHGVGSCYQSSGVWYNNKHFAYGSPAITAGEWHKVIAHYKLNTISNGIAQADGVLQYWLDDNLLIDYHDVVIRTGQHPNMKFNQFVLSPYIGDGSPIDQTMWIDNLTVTTSAPIQTSPQQPKNSRIVQ